MNCAVDRRDFLRFASGGAVGAATSEINWQARRRLHEALVADEVDAAGEGASAWA